MPRILIPLRPILGVLQPGLEFETLLMPMEAIDTPELINMVATTIDDRPSCFKFPRGNSMGVPPLANNKGFLIKDFVLTWQAVKEEKDGSEGSLEWAKKAKTEPDPVCGYGNANRVETVLCFLLLQKPLSRPLILVLRCEDIEYV
ncbi:hypothetical protein Tco_1018418 [Tanacetum coccineum]|uniref:Uncharacterized protein n=1 Tax=Tanacetum coccineum TaxID=301880 RepID=A0ABQ5FVR4_9ASTR